MIWVGARAFGEDTKDTTKSKVMSWTGDDKVITQGNLSTAFKAATSDHLGDARLVTKGNLSSAFREATSEQLGALFLKSINSIASDINFIAKRLGRLEVTQLVTLCVTMVTAWHISKM